MADIGALVVKIAADASELHKEFAKLGSSSVDFGTKIATAGKVGATAILAVSSAITANTLAIAKQAEETEQMSQKTGISVQTLQGWSVVMAQNSVQAQQLTVATKTLSKEIVEARNPASAAASSFDELGISIAQLGSTDDAIKAIADKFQAMPDGAEKAALAVQLFGKSGLDMIPILNRGAAAFEESRKAAERFGLVLTNEQVKALTAVDDASDNLGLALKGLQTAFATTFAPSVKTGIELITRAIVSLGESIKGTTHELVKQDESWQAYLGRGIVADAQEQLKINAEVDADRAEREEALGRKLVARFQRTQRMIEAEKKAQEALGAVQLQIIQRTAKEENAAFAERVLEAERLQSLSEGVGTGNMAKLTGGAFEKSVEHIREAQRNLAEIWGAKQMDSADAISVMLEEEAKGRAIVEEGTQSWMHRNDVLENNVIVAESVERQQQVLFQSEQGLIGAADAARQVAFEANEQRYKLESAALLEQYNARLIGLATYNAKVHALDMDRETKRIQIVQQFPGFWEKQLNDLQASNVFSMASMVSTWSNSIATMVVKGGDLKAAWESTKIAVVQAAIQMSVAAAASAAKSFLVNEAAAAGTGGVWAGAASFVVGVWGSVATGMTAIFEAMVGIITAVGEGIMIVLSAIAEALADTIFGIPMAVAILAGVVVIGAALVALGAIKFAEGGIVTGPTLGMVGEAGPEAIIPLDRAGDMLGGGGNERPIHTTIAIDGKKFMKAVSRYTSAGWRHEGAPA